MVDKFAYEFTLKLIEMLLEARLDVGEVEYGIYALYDITNYAKLSENFDNRVDAYIYAMRYFFEHNDNTPPPADR